MSSSEFIFNLLLKANSKIPHFASGLCPKGAVGAASPRLLAVPLPTVGKGPAGFNGNIILH